jgi:glucokinase
VPRIKSFTIGFDLGGTKLAAALVRDDGQILDLIKVPVEMRREKNPKAAQTRIINLMADIAVGFQRRFPRECSRKYFKGIGLASAGPLNVETGTLFHPVNYPGWKIVPIRSMVEDKVRRRGFLTRVHFQNDAIAAALAEGWLGKARGKKSYAVVTIGTGIGSKVIFQGRPCQSRGAGSEFGHTVVNLRTLQSGQAKLSDVTIEGIASGTALLRRARSLGFRGTSVEELVLRKELKFKNLFRDMAWALAALCYDLSIGFHLEGIYLSGGLIKIKPVFFKEMQTHYKLMIQSFNPMFACPISVAKTRNRAGVLGAAFLPYLK